MKKEITEMLMFFVITGLFFVSVKSSMNIEGYYWREYAGKVPSDALAGGVDYNGDAIYMGQILHDGNLSPAKIYLNDNKAYYGFHNKEQIGTQDIKILCSQYPERFAWIKTDYDKIHLLTKHHIVLGGRHPNDNKTMYFGRAYYRDETSVGRVSTGPVTNRGLYITQNGGEYNFRTFEILTYNQSIGGAPIDVRVN